MNRFKFAHALTLLVGILDMIMTSLGRAQNTIDKERIRYAAIGDSYSIGEGASPNESWPALLTRHLNDKDLPVDLVANPSRTGWTAKDAIDRELPVFVESKPDFATLQIGVNDWVQGVDAETFRKNFTHLVDRLLAMLRGKNR